MSTIRKHKLKHDPGIWRALRRITIKTAKIVDYPRSYIDGMLSAKHFEHVQTYCMFLGMGRSGHTLVGALLNAHPNALIANELDAIGYIDIGVTRNQLYSLLLRRDGHFARVGRKHKGYDYDVAGQWAGRFRTIQVIGDKRGGASSKRLATKPWLLDRLRRTIGIPVHIIHHVRNPYDSIATMVKRSNDPLHPTIDRFFDRAHVNRKLLSEISPAEQLTTHHEALTAEPERTLTSIIEFLGLNPSPDYIAACARIVFPSPGRARTADLVINSTRSGHFVPIRLFQSASIKYFNINLLCEYFDSLD